MPDAIAWVDEVAPDEAVGICGAKMGRLAARRASSQKPRQCDHDAGEDEDDDQRLHDHP